jgi:hypothetical protein
MIRERQGIHMDDKQAFDRINELLEDTDYPVRITSRADIEDFLIDDDNRRFNQFAEVGRIFDDLVGRPEIDRYTDVSVSKEEEQNKSPY